MVFFSSFAGGVSLCSQHWCTCNILHRFVKVSIQIRCLALFSQTITSLYIDPLISFNTNLCQILLSVEGFWRKAGLSVWIFWMGKQALTRKTYCDYAGLGGRERNLRSSHLFPGYHWFSNSCFLVRYLHWRCQEVKRALVWICNLWESHGVQSVRVWAILAVVVASFSWEGFQSFTLIGGQHRRPDAVLCACQLNIQLKHPWLVLLDLWR